MYGTLLVLVLTTISLQYTESRFTSETELTQSIAYRSDVRNINELLNNIKNNAKNVQNSIMNIAENTKAKIKQWIGSIKDRAHNLTGKLDERIKNIREKNKKLLEKLLDTEKLVKKCFENEKKNTDELLRQVTKYVASCVSGNLLPLTHLDNHELRLELNNTNFVNEIEQKTNECVTTEDVDECLYKVRVDMYSTMESMEKEFLTTKTEARGIADDVLDAVVNCSVKGLIDASIVITNESIQIISCIVNKGDIYKEY